LRRGRRKIKRKRKDAFGRREREMVDLSKEWKVSSMGPGEAINLDRIGEIVQDAWEELKKRGNSKYKGEKVEPIDLIRGGGMLRDFALGNIIKYAYRNRAMTNEVVNLKDVSKIIHYAEMLKVEFGGGG
jgi:hypothetical protein